MGRRLLSSSLPPLIWGVMWSAVMGFAWVGYSPQTGQTIAVLATARRSGWFLRASGLGWSGQRERWVGRPHTRQERRIEAYRSGFGSLTLGSGGSGVDLESRVAPKKTRRQLAGWMYSLRKPVSTPPQGRSEFNCFDVALTPS
jgi:hypothetical protein